MFEAAAFIVGWTSCAINAVQLVFTLSDRYKRPPAVALGAVVIGWLFGIVGAVCQVGPSRLQA